MFELNQKVAVKNWDNCDLGVITGETPKFWKISVNGKTHLFYKEHKSSWRSGDYRESRSDGLNAFVLTPALQAQIDATTAKRAELAQKAADARAERKAFDDAEKAWRLSPEGLAQTARENDLEGLTIAQDIDRREDGTIYARFTLVGQYQKNHASEIEPTHVYAKVEVSRRMDWDWDTNEIVRGAPQISVYGLNDSVTYVRNMHRLTEVAIEFASTIED